jgi:membrane protein implicated in regulation of membrane protease activity
LNIGDLLFQLIFFILLIGIVAAVFYAVRSIVVKEPDNSKNIERKLDRIIELLEKDNKG